MNKVLVLLIIISTFSCKTQFVEQEKTYIPKDEQEDVVEKKIPKARTAYYFIRHAESNGHRSTNPHLSTLGLKRIKKYAEFFNSKKIDTVFTTNTNRTIETANAIAKTNGTPIIFYDPLKVDYQQFFKEHKNQTYVIVGHSDSTPNFANHIIGRPKYSQMVEENFSDIFEVVIDVNNTLYDTVLVLEDEIQKIEDAKLSPKDLKKVLKERRKKAKKK